MTNTLIFHVFDQRISPTGTMRHSIDFAGKFMAISFEGWTLALGFANLAILVLATLAALRQLATVARQSQFTGAVEFQRLTREAEVRVVKLIATFPVIHDSAGFDRVPKNVLDEARLVINSLNDTGQLLEAGLIDKELYFGLYHTQILRLNYLLKGFLAWEERRVGGRYGRRLLRLETRAKRYHDIRRIHRNTIVTIPRVAANYEVYRSKIKPGICGILQRVAWSLRWHLRKF